MKSMKLKNGSLEKLVQRELRVRGLRFQRHVRSLPGRPDIVFRKEKVAVFVDGDFLAWPATACLGTQTLPLLARQAPCQPRRDQRNFRRQRLDGWRVIRIWQHEIKKNIAGRIERVVLALFE